MKNKTHYHTFIFGLSLLLFNWPVISIVMKGNPASGYTYLYLSWFCVIFFMFFLSAIKP